MAIKFRTIITLMLGIWLALVMMLAVNATLINLRINWLMLVLIYLRIYRSNLINMPIAWGLGMVLDVLLGLQLGQYALSFVVLIYLSDWLRNRMKLFILWQQIMVLLILISTSFLTLFISELIINPLSSIHTYWGMVFSSLCCYPLVHLLFNRALD